MIDKMRWAWFVRRTKRMLDADARRLRRVGRWGWAEWLILAGIVVGVLGLVGWPWLAFGVPGGSR